MRMDAYARIDMNQLAISWTHTADVCVPMKGQPAGHVGILPFERRCLNYTLMDHADRVAPVARRHRLLGRDGHWVGPHGGTKVAIKVRCPFESASKEQNNLADQ